MTFIQNNLNQYTVSQLCSALKFPRSTYFKALVSVSSNRQREYGEFGRKVKQAFDDSKQRYGAVKICRTLNDSGTPCSIKRVQRHMAEQGLRSIVVKKYNHHANHGTVPDDKVNILKRDFEAETINQKWLYEEVKEYFADVELCKEKEGSGNYKKTKEKAHSQIETREYYQTEDIGWLAQKKLERS